MKPQPSLRGFGLLGCMFAGLALSACVDPTVVRVPELSAETEPSETVETETEAVSPDGSQVPVSADDPAGTSDTDPASEPEDAFNLDPADEIVPITDLGTTTDVFPETLDICGSMTISNRPAQVEDLQITNYRPVVAYNGVEIAVAPVEDACFSSGFGPRGESLHKGIDLYNHLPVPVYAGGDGLVRRKLYRDDYGNMVVIDHGGGVFTRYAHLQEFAPGLEVGGTVSAGDALGIMGNTASYSIPRHLHYEVLTGEWGALSGSFGLEAINLMDQLPDN